MSAPPWSSCSTTCRVARGSCCVRRQVTPSGDAMSRRPRTNAAEDEPALDAMQVPQCLDVVDQMTGGDRGQVDARFAREWPTASTTPLVEQGHAVSVRVEEGAPPWLGAGPGAAVQHHGWFATRVPDPLPVDLVSVTHFDEALLKGSLTG